MQAATGRFAAGQQAANAGSAACVGCKPANHVMRGRAHRNRLFVWINVEFAAKPVDIRESGAEAAKRQMPGVEVHVRGAVASHNGHDLATDHIARGEFGVGMAAYHESVARPIDQIGAFASHRLADERS